MNMPSATGSMTHMLCTYSLQKQQAQQHNKEEKIEAHRQGQARQCCDDKHGGVA